MKLEKVNIDLLKPAEYNPRKELKPSDKEYQKIKNSIEEFGYVDPIIVNKDYTVIGGHQRINVLKDLGYKEVDVVIIDIDKTKEKALNIALNKITGEWDFTKLSDLLLELDNENYNLLLTGFDMKEIEDLMAPVDDLTNVYTTKINIPQYEITGEEPEISELVNTDKVDQLLQEIENSSLDDEKKNFLRIATTRLYTFNYSNIAEYYAHQDKEMQELMEKIALVIIDIKNAIANGYVELSNTLEEMLNDET